MSDEPSGTCATCAHWRGRGTDRGRCATPAGMWAVAICEGSAVIHTLADHGCRAWTPRRPVADMDCAVVPPGDGAL